MSGLDLAEAAVRMRVGLRIIFILGRSMDSAFNSHQVDQTSNCCRILTGDRSWPDNCASCWTVVRVDYCCDEPTLRRGMRISVSPITIDGDVCQLLCQSIIVSTEQRPAIALFGAAIADQDAEDIVSLCTICARVAWPVGALRDDREWIEPHKYYQRGGADVPVISHGFCKQCFAKLQEQD